MGKPGLEPVGVVLELAVEYKPEPERVLTVEYRLALEPERVVERRLGLARVAELGWVLELELE